MQISWSVFPWVSTHLPVCDVRKMMGRPHQSPKAIYNIIEKSAGFQNINFQAHCIYYSLHCYFLHYVVSFFFPNCKVLIFILFVFCNKWCFLCNLCFVTLFTSIVCNINSAMFPLPTNNDMTPYLLTWSYYVQRESESVFIMICTSFNFLAHWFLLLLVVVMHWRYALYCMVQLILCWTQKTVWECECVCVRACVWASVHV